jgi:transcriptional regulator with XRE-family HTH domain
MSKRRRSNQYLDELRAAFREAADTTPAQVADTYEARVTYERESLSLQILDSVQAHMQKEDITQQQLAEALDVTEGRVSQILSGEQNLTLKTLASVAAALQAHFDIQLVPTVGASWEQPGRNTRDHGTGAAPTPASVPVPAHASSQDRRQRADVMHLV